MNIVGKIKYIGFAVVASVLFTACNFLNKDNETSAEQATSAPQIGDQVPSNLVCMVNNVYMGEPQLEVPFEGKRYYVSCEMCEERILKEKKVRSAVDLYSLNGVDKADAYIVLIGEGGKVAYFESENNYGDLMGKSDRAKRKLDRK